eukprot:TRINITY_DN85105_c0_g1_i1.p2 TRINITY_DN85105_c0_g1~~TRINITY_DN85105_c0_g1_i1.p2  ORF type:complete len:169 (+),score=16.10 TRINITY_DN85105_c0_g1_i1:26-532(+)
MSDEGAKPWLLEPPYGCGGGNAETQAKYVAQCHCGAVQFEATADPVDAKICHCKGCQQLQGAPMQWAVLFHKHHIRFTKGAEDSLDFYNSEVEKPERILPCKVYCKHCHSPLADEGRRMFLSFGPAWRFNDGVVPECFKPTCHIFYGSRVLDIADDKPKYVAHKPSTH